LFGVILVMALFAAFSTGLFVTSVKDKLAAGTTSEIKLHNTNLLFERIIIDGKNTTVLNGLRDAWEENKNEAEFKSTVLALTPENECTVLAWKWSGTGAGDNVFGYLFSKNSEIKSEVINGDFNYNKILDLYRKENLLSEIQISFVDKIEDGKVLEKFNDIITYYSYRGQCK
jgi:hypothetical protein